MATASGLSAVYNLGTFASFAIEQWIAPVFTLRVDLVQQHAEAQQLCLESEVCASDAVHLLAECETVMLQAGARRLHAATVTVANFPDKSNSVD